MRTIYLMRQLNENTGGIYSSTALYLFVRNATRLPPDIQVEYLETNKDDGWYAKQKTNYTPFKLEFLC